MFSLIHYGLVRTVSLSELSLTAETKLSLPLIMEQLSPSALLNLAHLAGILDLHSIPDILKLAHTDQVGACDDSHVHVTSVIAIDCPKGICISGGSRNDERGGF